MARISRYSSRPMVSSTLPPNGSSCIAPAHTRYGRGASPGTVSAENTHGSERYEPSIAASVASPFNLAASACDRTFTASPLCHLSATARAVLLQSTPRGSRLLDLLDDGLSVPEQSRAQERPRRLINVVAVRVDTMKPQFQASRVWNARAHTQRPGHVVCLDPRRKIGRAHV